MNNGCTAIMTNKNLDLPNKINIIKSDNVLQDLSYLSYKFFGPFNTKLIGITGTNGKTSSCLILKSLISQLGFKVIYIGTLGIHYQDQIIDTDMTTPDSLTICKILNKYSDADYCVMEVSSHALELYRVNNLEFEVVALTNITSDHLDFHKTKENYIKAKLKIFDLKSNHKLINKECQSLLPESTNIYQIKTFGVNKESDFYFKDYIQNRNKLEFTFFDSNRLKKIQAPYFGK